MNDKEIQELAKALLRPTVTEEHKKAVVRCLPTEDRLNLLNEIRILKNDRPNSK